MLGSVLLILSTREFVVNVDPQSISLGGNAKKSFTWDTGSILELSLLLNAASNIEDEGWVVGLESPLTGVQRSYRIPILAFREDQVLLVKPVRDPKKVNVAGLKLLDLQHEFSKVLPNYESRAVVYACMDNYDSLRRSSDEYCIWIKGSNGLLD
jgi:hypothetical protein